MKFMKYSRDVHRNAFFGGWGVDPPTCSLNLSRESLIFISGNAAVAAAAGKCLYRHYSRSRLVLAKL